VTQGPTRSARTNRRDFPDDLGKAIPYGVYDVGENAKWVLVGADYDTAAFAVHSLRRWWEKMGRAVYPAADKLLICADAGGSNSYRTRLRKVELAGLAAETGFEITFATFLLEPRSGTRSSIASGRCSP